MREPLRQWGKLTVLLTVANVVLWEDVLADVLSALVFSSIVQLMC